MVMQRALQQAKGKAKAPVSFWFGAEPDGSLGRMKWNSTPVIALVAVFVFVAAAVLLIRSGGGDDNGATQAPRSTPASGEFGDPPRLGDNVEAVSPAHGETVTQSSTLPVAGGSQPGGVCATVNFQDFGLSPDTIRWFHLAFDGELVTQLTTVYADPVNSDTGIPDGAVICYTPDEGIPVGMHTAAVSVGDPSIPAAPARQLVGWSFEVVP